MLRDMYTCSGTLLAEGVLLAEGLVAADVVALVQPLLDELVHRGELEAVLDQALQHREVRLRSETLLNFFAEI